MVVCGVIYNPYVYEFTLRKFLVCLVKQIVHLGQSPRVCVVQIFIVKIASLITKYRSLVLSLFCFDLGKHKTAFYLYLVIAF